MLISNPNGRLQDNAVGTFQRTRLEGAIVQAGMLAALSKVGQLLSQLQSSITNIYRAARWPNDDELRDGENMVDIVWKNTICKPKRQRQTNKEPILYRKAVEKAVI